MKAVVDANVVIHGGRNSPFEQAVTVPEVFQELESVEAQRNADTMDLEVKEPENNYLDEVEALSESINSPTSVADEKLAALALSDGCTLVTDDKALQNLASILGIDFQAFLDTEIDTELEWIDECSNCRSTVSSESCDRCGSELVQRKSRPYN